MARKGGEKLFIGAEPSELRSGKPFLSEVAQSFGLQGSHEDQ